jgi:hypothetical protein
LAFSTPVTGEPSGFVAGGAGVARGALELLLQACSRKAMEEMRSIGFNRIGSVPLFINRSILFFSGVKLQGLFANWN